MSYAPGYRQIAILRTVSGGEWFVSSKRSVQLSCMRLHDLGLLARDPKNSYRFTSTEAGDALIREHDDRISARIEEARA